MVFGLGKLDEKKFGELVAKLAIEEGLGETAEVDHEQFRVLVGDFVFNLTNVYAQFLTLSRRERRSFILQNLRATRQVHEQIPKSWEEAGPKVMPRLRNAVFFDGIEAEGTLTAGEGGQAPAPPPTVEIADGLIVTYVVDSELTMMTVGEEMLNDWAIDLDAVVEQARRNLVDATETQGKFDELAPGVWMALWDDAYAASRLLLPHVMHQVTTDPIVAVPSRDMLLVAQPRHPGALESLVAVLEQTLEEEAYPLTRQLYQLVGTRYEKYDFPQDNAASDRYHNVLCVDRAHRYEDQKPILQEQLGEDVYVASVMIFELEGGRYTSFATWTDGVPTLLPEVDQVVLGVLDVDGESSDPSYTAPFAKLLELPGALVKTSHWLPRWETKSFPSAEVLAEIGEAIEDQAETPAD